MQSLKKYTGNTVSEVDKLKLWEMYILDLHIQAQRK